MSTTNYSDLLPDIIPMAPEAPDMLIIKHVKETVIDFCQRTNIYQHEQTIDAFKDVSDYTLVPPTDTVAHRILWTNFDGRDLEPISPSLKEQRVPAAPVLTLSEAIEHPHAIKRGAIRKLDDPFIGSFPIPGQPPLFSRWKYNDKLRAPLLGEHNKEVFQTLCNFNESEIEELENEGIIIADTSLN